MTPYKKIVCREISHRHYAIMDIFWPLPLPLPLTMQLLYEQGVKEEEKISPTSREFL